MARNRKKEAMACLRCFPGTLLKCMAWRKRETWVKNGRVRSYFRTGHLPNTYLEPFQCIVLLARGGIIRVMIRKIWSNCLYLRQRRKYLHLCFGELRGLPVAGFLLERQISLNILMYNNCKKKLREVMRNLGVWNGDWLHCKLHEPVQRNL